MGQEYQRHFEDFRKSDKHEKGGLVRLSGAFLTDHETDLLNLIKHESKLAEERNPEHKVTKLVKVDGSIVVETSEHTLAMHIGKSIAHAYKGNHEYKFRPGEKFVEVDWERD